MTEEELMKELENCIVDKESFSVKKEEPSDIKILFPEVPRVNKVDVWRKKFDEKVRAVV